jgi:L,D-transpeptidase YcbB
MKTFLPNLTDKNLQANCGTFSLLRGSFQGQIPTADKIIPTIVKFGTGIDFSLPDVRVVGLLMKIYVLRIRKYLLVLFCLLVLAGCQQQLVPRVTSVPKTIVRQDSVVVTKSVEVGSPVYIDINYDMDAAIDRIYFKDNYFSKKVREKIKLFYQKNNFQTKWLSQFAANDLYTAFIADVNESNLYGLNPSDYSINEIESQLGFLYPSKNEAAIIDLDIRITGMFFLFSTHLIDGRVKKTGGGDKIWIREYDSKDDVSILASTTDIESLHLAITKLQPETDQYKRMQAALKHYKTLAEKNQDNDAPIVAKDKIKPNDVNKAIPAIRKKLALTDMKFDSTRMDSTRYDEQLVSAVKWFQLRHGLEPDGIIGGGTLKFLNQSIKQKISIIELNLERLRWYPQDQGSGYIVVNIPEYKLRVFDDHKQTLEMKVIVGAENTATPIFSDTLHYIVFSPTWAVPTSIIKNEVIPHLQNDSTYYSGKNYTFYKGGVEFDPSTESWKGQSVNPYAYNVVQQPGADNALGLVKFIMPNRMSIYLHDTPNHRLFSKSYRALSHGCVRLDEPSKLAEYFLSSQKGWTMEMVTKAMYANQTQTIHLKKPYRVQLEYRTAWVDDNGMVNFREDIYGHDARQMEQLAVSEEEVAVKINSNNQAQNSREN